MSHFQSYDQTNSSFSFPIFHKPSHSLWRLYILEGGSAPLGTYSISKNDAHLPLYDWLLHLILTWVWSPINNHVHLRNLDYWWLYCARNNVCPNLAHFLFHDITFIIAKPITFQISLCFGMYLSYIFIKFDINVSFNPYFFVTSSIDDEYLYNSDYQFKQKEISKLMCQSISKYSLRRTQRSTRRWHTRSSTQTNTSWGSRRYSSCTSYSSASFSLHIGSSPHHQWCLWSCSSSH